MPESAGGGPSLVRETLGWMLGRRRRIRVVGESMTPTLSPGQYVLIDPGRAAVAGDLVVARHPDRDPLRVIKRVGSIEVDGRYVLTSDNPEVGTDSRTWGPLNADLIEGTVTLLLDRPSAKL